MKILLLKDVYKLGRAGDVKKVANGYGRNYLIPQGFAIPATPNSIKMAETIGKKASELRAVLNNELKGVADILQGLEVRFPVKAGETGKLYGSVSAQMIIDKLKEMKDIEVLRHQLVMEPIRNLGEYDIPVNLTLDLVPEIKVIVHREGEVRKVVVPEPVLETVAQDIPVEEEILVAEDIPVEDEEAAEA